jgi:hypothetical protein
MITNILLSSIIALCLINLIFSLSISNFIVKMADLNANIKKDLEDFYFIQNKQRSSPSPNAAKQQESGLVDL